MEKAGRIERRGILFVLSSPSGAGKTTMARRLLAAEPQMAVSVSATTRAKRPGEVDGIDYHFRTEAQFDRMVEAGEFLEWAHVFGNRYGTPRAAVEAALGMGRDVLFDVDWQGTQQLSQSMGDDVVSVFLLPPTMAELERRLRARRTDSEDVIEGRMARAAAEISHWPEYDYVLVNEDMHDCFEQIHTIVHAERLRRQRRGAWLTEFTREMVGKQG
ncbi:guanylate kinase [Sphingosinicella microcystinivorans]|uniref:guanylate kinase n=1 Tax=Sphingosinicella microcystinivorans TaxID=335406 RepID=UPI0022F37D92|nr:guanylate kinase [Sphingosinicella microcystinivorans]WBX86389.1 guanylate kinase [Sphingosinicella microcystinivorans]